MPKTRVILELGSGNDLHGSDYTKAALRAVQDALHHSSLSFIRSLKFDKTKLDVEVTVGVQRPERVDLEAVKKSLPVGNVTVNAVKGGLDVYPYALRTRKSAGLMTRKLSVTESQKTAQFFGTSSRRKCRTDRQNSL